MILQLEITGGSLPMLDNVKVAIFTKLNELAERHGLKPYDFVAVQKEAPGFKISLQFEVHATGNALKERQYDKMLHSLGISEDGSELQGTDSQIIDALDSALHHAPKRHSRP
jgi:hypothetical protein